MTPSQIASYKRVCAELSPTGTYVPVIDMERARRAQRIADARALLDLIEACPDVPFDELEVRYCVLAADDESGVAEVRAAADALGVSCDVNGDRARAELWLGASSYHICYNSRRAMHRWSRERALGTAARVAEEVGAGL